MTFYRIVRAVVGVYLRLVYRVEYIGQENLPKTGGYLLVSNHRSAYDPLFLVCGLEPQVCYMAKEELMKIPVLGWLLGQLGVFGVRRGTGDATAVDTAVQRVNDGRIVGIFPEGTRAPAGATLRPKSGASHIAGMCKCGVLPCCVSIDGDLKAGKRVRICYGRFIPYEELGLEAGGSTGLRSATRAMWHNGVLPLLERLEGPLS